MRYDTTLSAQLSRVRGMRLAKLIEAFVSFWARQEPDAAHEVVAECIWDFARPDGICTCGAQVHLHSESNNRGVRVFERKMGVRCAKHKMDKYWWKLCLKCRIYHRAHWDSKLPCHVCSSELLSLNSGGGTYIRPTPFEYD